MSDAVIVFELINTKRSSSDIRSSESLSIVLIHGQTWLHVMCMEISQGADDSL